MWGLNTKAPGRRKLGRRKGSKEGGEKEHGRLEENVLWAGMLFRPVKGQGEYLGAQNTP